MRSLPRVWIAAILLSLASLLSFLARTFIDYGYVYEEFGLHVPSLTLITLFNLALFAGWIWALVSASHQSRKAMYVLAVYDGFLILFGLLTLASFCPSPCRTAWPLGEAAIWANLLVGIPALAGAVLALRAKTSNP